MRTEKARTAMPDVTKTAKDALYVTVGLGVLAVQKAQVGRRELAKQVETQLNETGQQVQRLSKLVEQRVQPVLTQLESALPDSARDLVKQARTAAKEAQQQLFGRNGRSTQRRAA